jgi:hypothetical protein
VLDAHISFPAVKYGASAKHPLPSRPEPKIAVYHHTHSRLQQWDLRSSGMLRSVDLQVVNDVSEQPIGPIFKGQAVQEDGTGRLFQNVDN